MRTSSRENEPGVQQGQKSVWGNLIVTLVSFIKRLTSFLQLTEAEQEEAGIHIEHQGGE